MYLLSNMAVFGSYLSFQGWPSDALNGTLSDLQRSGIKFGHGLKQLAFIFAFVLMFNIHPKLENYVSFPETKLRVGRGWPFFLLGKHRNLLAGASFPSFPEVSVWLGTQIVIFFMVDPILSCSLEPQTTSLKWMFLWNHHFFPTVTIWNHPIETTIYIWLKNPGTVGKWTINNSSLWREPVFKNSLSLLQCLGSTQSMMYTPENWHGYPSHDGPWKRWHSGLKTWAIPGDSIRDLVLGWWKPWTLFKWLLVTLQRSGIKKVALLESPGFLVSIR